MGAAWGVSGCSKADAQDLITGGRVVPRTDTRNMEVKGYLQPIGVIHLNLKN